MTNELFDVFKRNVIFKGIALKEYTKGEFYVLFEIKGTEFIIDSVLREKEENHPVWNLEHAKIYHYDSSENEESHNCVFCSYEYSGKNKMSEETLCKELNEDMFLEGVWGSCIMQEQFVNRWNKMIAQNNPKELEKIN